MISAAVFALFLSPLLYVGVRQRQKRRAAMQALPDCDLEFHAITGGCTEFQDMADMNQRFLLSFGIKPEELSREP